MTRADALSNFLTAPFPLALAALVVAAVLVAGWCERACNEAAGIDDEQNGARHE